MKPVVAPVDVSRAPRDFCAAKRRVLYRACTAMKSASRHTQVQYPQEFVWLVPRCTAIPPYARARTGARRKSWRPIGGTAVHRGTRGTAPPVTSPLHRGRRESRRTAPGQWFPPARKK